MAVIKGRYLSTMTSKGHLKATTYSFDDTPVDLHKLKSEILKLKDSDELMKLIKSTFKFEILESKLTDKTTMFKINKPNVNLTVATTKIAKAAPNFGSDRCVVWQNDLIYAIFKSRNLINSSDFDKFLKQVKKADPVTKYFDDYLSQLNFIFEYDIDFKTIFYKLKLDKMKISQKQINNFIQQHKKFDENKHNETSKIHHSAAWLLKNLKTKWQKQLFSDWLVTKNIKIIEDELTVNELNVDELKTKNWKNFVCGIGLNGKEVTYQIQTHNPWGWDWPDET